MLFIDFGMVLFAVGFIYIVSANVNKLFTCVWNWYRVLSVFLHLEMCGWQYVKIQGTEPVSKRDESKEELPSCSDIVPWPFAKGSYFVAKVNLFIHW